MVLSGESLKYVGLTHLINNLKGSLSDRDFAVPAACKKQRNTGYPRHSAQEYNVWKIYQEIVRLCTRRSALSPLEALPGALFPVLLTFFHPTVSGKEAVLTKDIHVPIIRF